MQNLPVIAASTPPATSAQASAAPDNNGAASAAEPFGSVLARQRANAGTPQESKPADGNKKPASAAANDASATAAGNDPAVDPQAAIPDAASLLPGDVLAALLPASSGAAATGNDKASPQAATPDGVSTLPSDMLAMLLPGAVAKGAGVAKSSGSQDSMPDSDRKAQPIAAAVLGEIRQIAGNISGNKAAASAAEAPAISVAQSASAAPGTAALSGMQRNAKPEAIVTGANAGKENTFAAALETLSKDAAKTAQFDTGASKAAAQPVESAALDSMLQSGVAPISASPTGPAQVVQAAINTPVSHEGWGDEFNQKITWMATQNEQTAELHLNPPNLGPLDVVLNVSGDQATALFTSPHAAVREAVEQALPKLRDMMADNGIMLGNAMVSDQSPKDQQAWQAEQRQKGGGSSGKIDATAAAGSIPSGTAASLGRRHHGMVDTFA